MLLLRKGRENKKKIKRQEKKEKFKKKRKRQKNEREIEEVKTHMPLPHKLFDCNNNSEEKIQSVMGKLSSFWYF